jgi:NhaA family Na+:H+ antiporter
VIHRPPPAVAPETWAPARRIAERIFRPIERFLHVQAASGIMLLVAAVAAIAWANSPWSASYEHLWHTPISLGVGGFVFARPLHFWVNEGLMGIFFLVVGLEIRREIYEGELSDLRRASLPIAAALGGMIAPALIYLALNREPPAQGGWGVPMATDIAFAVGVLSLLGKRVPAALRVLLLALAIIDDIGAILVIAIFYSSGVAWSGLAIAAAGVAGVLVLQGFGVRHALVYTLPGTITWIGMLRAGIHPTIAGVVLGLLTPARSWFGVAGFMVAARDALDRFRVQAESKGHDDQALLEPLRAFKRAQREVVPPVVRVQTALHPWVAFGIMPLFALANAGVSLSGVDFSSAASMTVVFGVTLGLVVGKPLGVVAASALMVKLGLCALPRGTSWGGIVLVGCVAGIGFTMAIFIAGLAFADAALLAAAKLAILVASAVSGALALAYGRVSRLAAPRAGAAESEAEAEASTEQ